MRHKWQWVGLILILIAAAGLRFTGLDWDNYLHYHPDERFISWVATTIEAPTDLSTAFDPHQSTFNPYYWPTDAESEGVVVPQDEARRFAYGHLPLYLGVAATRFTGWLEPLLAPGLPQDWLFTQHVLNVAEATEYDHITAVGRALTGLFDLGTVLLIFLLGRRLWGVGVGLTAAAFLAVNVMHIQLAHFFTTDPYITFFAVAAVYCMVLAAGAGPLAVGRWPLAAGLSTQHRLAPRKATALSTRLAYLAAIMIGFSVGSKFAGVLLLIPLALLFWFDGQRPLRQRLFHFCLAVLLAFFVFFLTNPFAILDLTCQAISPPTRLGPFRLPALDWKSCYLENIGRQGAMVRGENDLGFVRQYAGTTPYLYYIEMQLRWGMGPLLGAAAFGGLLWAVGYVTYRFYRQFTASQNNETEPEEHPLLLFVNYLRQPVNWLTSNHPGWLLVLAWVIPFFISTGNFQVKFMRYLQPIVPFLMLLAAALIWQIKQKTVRGVLLALVLLTTGLYAWSFVNIYQEPHPWAAASEWIYANVEPGARIYSEQWDDALPTSLAIDGVRRRRAEYLNKELTWLTGTEAADSETKLKLNLAALADADYIVLASNRVYGVVPRLPERYPLSSQYYDLLFGGSLGYEVVYTSGRFPHLGNFHLKGDSFSWPGLTPPPEVAAYLQSVPGINWGRFDESFTVYDQPLPIILENKEHLAAAEMLDLFDLNP